MAQFSENSLFKWFIALFLHFVHIHLIIFKNYMQHTYSTFIQDDTFIYTHLPFLLITRNYARLHSFINYARWCSHNFLVLLDVRYFSCQQKLRCRGFRLNLRTRRRFGGDPWHRQQQPTHIRCQVSNIVILRLVLKCGSISVILFILILVSIEVMELIFCSWFSEPHDRLPLKFSFKTIYCGKLNNFARILIE